MKALLSKIQYWFWYCPLCGYKNIEPDKPVGVVVCTCEKTFTFEYEKCDEKLR